jgi:tetratricopeptide (TPR) repeat protein
MLVDAMEGDVDDLIEFQAVMMLAGIRHRQGRFEESAAHCRTVIDAARVEDHPAVQAHALNLLSLNAAHLGDPSGRTHAERALEILEALGDWAATGRVLNNLAIQSYFAGRWDEAAELYRQGREASDRAGDVVMVATFDNNIAEILSDQGRFDDAAELFGRAAAIWSSTGYPVGEALVTSNRGRLAVRLGDLTAARELLDSALSRFQEMGAAALTFETETRMVELAICEGDATGAIEVLDRLDVEADQANPILLRLRAHALAIAGDGEAAAVFEAACRALEEQGPAYEHALALKGLAALTGDESGPAETVLDGLGAHTAFVLPVNR